MRLLSALVVLCLCACRQPVPVAEQEAPRPVALREKKAERGSVRLEPAESPTLAEPAPPSEAKKDVGNSIVSALPPKGGPALHVKQATLAEGRMGKSNGTASLGSAHGLAGASMGDAAGLGGLGLRGYGSGGGGLGAVGSGGGKLIVAGRAFGASEASSTESYGDYGVNPWTLASEDRLSTFAADVDTASYTIARRKILEGAVPPTESVRVEEFVNYFRYAYPQPEGALGVTLDAAPSPFSKGKHLLRVGVQGRRLSVSERKPAHLTFLVDVSGSMQSPDKLPLAKRALRMLVDNLRDGDTVALVTYAGSVRVVLPHTGLEHKAQIHGAIEALTAGGSTAMASGIELAYQQALKVLDGASTSRVVILSDGDANVGRTSPSEILALIAGHVKEGVTVTTVGFGMGNYKDDVMEQFANKGNGNHAYVDSLFEAKRIFQTELGGTLEVIAKDVKLQVDFDPSQVLRYRLVGYENRNIADRDFRNDTVDAGEIGSGHTVTALYEVELAPNAGAGLCTVRVRAKQPRGSEASERAFPFPATALASRFDGASRDFRFATAVMGAAELFRQSEHARSWSLEAVTEIAASAAGDDAERLEFVSLLQHAKPVMKAVASRN